MVCFIYRSCYIFSRVGSCGDLVIQSLEIRGIVIGYIADVKGEEKMNIRINLICKVLPAILAVSVIFWMIGMWIPTCTYIAYGLWGLAVVYWFTAAFIV